MDLYTVFVMVLMTTLSGVVQHLPWDLLCLLLPWLGLRFQVLRAPDVVRTVRGRLRRGVYTGDDGKFGGHSVGTWYWVHVSDAGGGQGTHGGGSRDAGPPPTCRIVATEASLQWLLGHGDGVAGRGPTVTTLARTSSWEQTYAPKQMAAGHFRAWPVQQRIIAGVIAHFRKSPTSTCVALVHGAPGAGKSMVGVLLARDMGATYCNAFHPWRANEHLAVVHAGGQPCPSAPLVLCFDDVDAVLDKVHADTIEKAGDGGRHTVITDKPSWNRFFDDVSRGMFPHVIIVMTTNKTPAAICALDPSYIRPGRVDLVFDMGAPHHHAE
jgi:hypothetical protein